jgi:hypothetical protein
MMRRHMIVAGVLVGVLSGVMATAEPLSAQRTTPAAAAAPDPALASLVEGLGNTARRERAYLDLLTWLDARDRPENATWLRVARVVPTLDAGAAGQVADLVHTALRAAPGAARNAPHPRTTAATALARMAGTDDAPAPAAPGLLELAAHLADPVSDSLALALRLRVVDEWPASPQAAEATIQAAPHLPSARATAMLDAFLLRAPQHPLAAEARRLRSAAAGGTPGGAP